MADCPLVMYLLLVHYFDDNLWVEGIRGRSYAECEIIIVTIFCISRLYSFSQ